MTRCHGKEKVWFIAFEQGVFRMKLPFNPVLYWRAVLTIVTPLILIRNFSQKNTFQYCFWMKSQMLKKVKMNQFCNICEKSLAFRWPATLRMQRPCGRCGQSWWGSAGYQGLRPNSLPAAGDGRVLDIWAAAAPRHLATAPHAPPPGRGGQHWRGG